MVAEGAEGDGGDRSAGEEVDIADVMRPCRGASGDDDGDFVFFKGEAIQFSEFRMGGGAFGFFVSERDEAIGEVSDVFAGVGADVEGYAAVDVSACSATHEMRVRIFFAGGHDFFCDLEDFADFLRVAVCAESLHGHGAQVLADEFR